MDRFALFQLPAVAISEVMKKFDLFEITMLLMCSKRTKKLVKTFRIPRDVLTIDIEFGAINAVCLSDKRRNELVYYYIDSSEKSTHEVVKIGDSIVPISIDDNYEDFEYEEDDEYSKYSLNLYFKDKIEGLKTVTEYFCSYFEQEIYLFRIEGESFIENGIMTVMDWILERQKTINGFRIEDVNVNETLANYVLDKLNSSSRVLMNMKVPDEFRANFKVDGEIDLSIHAASWFTFENLLNINCTDLNVENSQLTNADINSFLKHWMTNDLKFEHLRIQSEDEFIFDVIFSGIPTFRNPQRTFKNRGKVYRTVYNGIEVKRNDGLKTATIEIDPTNQRAPFYMTVWDTL
uniref:F-box domain-containing protein n=1 Tax=Caenorhabditis tropicalis TaxID=1561998 RepID=A0A1I7V0N7_9PELO